ncbi:MAG: hypothetical protein PHU21_10130 [Elusimicrobia bacterium]|nr:hypothetical protein [Elusimicrobiota bacterium]
MKSLLSLAALALAISPLQAQVPELSQLTAVQGFMEYAPAQMPATPEAVYVGQAYTLAAAAPAQAPQLPSQFSIKERVISFTDTFDVVSNGKKLGVITQKILSLTRSFKYKDADGNLVAEARSRVFSWGTHVDVTDSQGRPIGAIKEQVFKSLFKVYTAYSILDAQGREIALSEKVDWLGTEINISDKQGRRVAVIKRPWINFFSDHWDVQVQDPKAVDSRVMVMIAAYKTSVDNARRREARDRDSKKD